MTTTHPWRSSMFAQTAALIALALLAAHILGYVLIIAEQRRSGLIEASSSGVTRFVEVAQAYAQDVPGDGDETLLRQHSSFGYRFARSPQSGVSRDGLQRDGALERRLTQALQDGRVETIGVEAAWRERGTGPPLAPPGRQRWNLADGPPRPFPPGPPPFETSQDQRLRPPTPQGDIRRLVLAAELTDGHWINAEILLPIARVDPLPRLIAANALVYVFILAGALLVASRITQPLRALSQQADAVGLPGPTPQLSLRGPGEIKAVIRAFNAMSARVGSLLREKDELVGAIGHDLRTPLASLRIRVESAADPAERARMIETIEEMGRLVDDTLDIAQLGHSTEERRLVDLTALADSLVEEYRDRGLDVRFIESARAPVLIRPALTRRLVRNLIDNALKFGARATVAVDVHAFLIVLSIADEGPGVAIDDLARLTEPFVRLEPSRNRATGGAGLGLAIAARIAATEYATLDLANGSDRGLIATVSWERPISTLLPATDGGD